jgi:hypothetical protein
MAGAKVHFELFIRKSLKVGFVLELATEDRVKALEAAEEFLATRRAVAVKVSKETMDPETGEFQSISIFAKGDQSRPKAKAVVEDTGALCVSPQDLYSAHARERIGRLLDGWLVRNRATPFDLLHRPDLVEKLEASGTELQHAVQKIAVPEAQAKGLSVHEVIRTFTKLAEQAIERVLKHQRQGVFPDLRKEPFAAVAKRLVNDKDRGYLLGVGVANELAGAVSWKDKVDRLLDLADNAPTDTAARTLAFQVLEQPLAEILGARAGLADVLGNDLDLGGSLAALTRIAAPETVDAMVGMDPLVARLTPQLSGPAARLSNWLDSPHFESVRKALVRRVIEELRSPRRLRPNDPVGEIEIIRVLAMLLTASSGKMLSHDDIREAFTLRSAALVASDFVSSYLQACSLALEEVQALVRLAENITGAANKRQAAQWLAANITGLRFEREMREGPDSAAAKLTVLLELQRAIGRAGLQEAESDDLCAKLGDLGGVIEAESRLVASIARAPTTVGQRLALLLRLASCEAGPSGPVALRAKAEVLKLIKTPETRNELAGSPEAVARLRPLMQAAGLAA